MSHHRDAAGNSGSTIAGVARSEPSTHDLVAPVIVTGISEFTLR
jgi:hypothetical protein